MNKQQEEEVNRRFNGKASSMTEDDLNGIVEKEQKVMSLFGKLGKHAKDIKLLWNMLRDYKNGDYTEVPWKLIGSIVFAFIYLVSPIDVIPDVIPILGFTDDISVFGLVLAGFGSDIEAYKAWLAAKAGTKSLENK